MKVNATSSSFIDAIANALGVLIIVTLLIVLLSQYFTNKEQQQDNIVNGQQRTTVEHGREFIIGETVCRKTIIRPWSTEYIVLSDRVVPLNKHAISKAIIETGNHWGQIDEGEWSIFLGKNINRDIDSFELTFVPDSHAIQKKYSAWQKSELETLLAGLPTNSILFFFVYPSGMEVFASLYPLLLQQSVIFQAIYQPDSTSEAILWRDSEQFKTFEIDYFC